MTQTFRVATCNLDPIIGFLSGGINCGRRRLRSNTRCRSSHAPATKKHTQRTFYQRELLIPRERAFRDKNPVSLEAMIYFCHDPIKLRGSIKNYILKAIQLKQAKIFLIKNNGQIIRNAILICKFHRYDTLAPNFATMPYATISFAPHLQFKCGVFSAAATLSSGPDVRARRRRECK